MLAAGADVLPVSGVTVNWETAIDGGEGNNVIVVDGCHLNYNLGIQTYGGTDAVTIKGTTIYGALQVQLGNGSANALTMLNVSVLQGMGGPDDSSLPEGFEILECALPREECGANIVGGTGVDVDRDEQREDRLLDDTSTPTAAWIAWRSSIRGSAISR